VASAPAARLITALLGALIVLPALRMTGHYVAIATLGIGEIVALVILNWSGLTRGPLGLSGIPAPSIGSIEVDSPRALYWLMLALVVLFGLLQVRLLDSHLGRTWRAIREDEVAVRAYGVEPLRYKALAFAFGGFGAGVAGATAAHLYSYINPDTFDTQLSILAITVVILGGARQCARRRARLGAAGRPARAISSRRRIPDAHLWRRAAVVDPPPAPRPVGDRMTAPMLEISGLSRRFGGVAAVDRLELAVLEGELIGVIGPNGAGKTTLFNLVSGFDRPDAGGVRLNGTDVTGRSPERLARLGLARTFQHGRVFGNLSVLDNVLVGAHARLAAVRPGWRGFGPVGELLLAAIRPGPVRREEAALRAEAERILARFGDRLTPRLDHPAYSLSYANRRRLELARALALRPRLLLLDEPTAGMNETETAEMEKTIAELKPGGLTILLIEHKLDMVMRLSDRVLAMDDGRRIALGVPNEVRDHPAVVEAYLGHSARGRNDANVAAA